VSVARNRGRDGVMDDAQARGCMHRLFEQSHDADIDRLLSAAGSSVQALMKHHDRFELVEVLIRHQRAKPGVAGGWGANGWTDAQPHERAKAPEDSELAAHVSELQRAVASLALTALGLGVLRTGWRAPGSVTPQALRLRFFDAGGEAGHMQVAVNASGTWHEGAVHAAGLCTLIATWQVDDLTVSYQQSAARGISLAAPAPPQWASCATRLAAAPPSSARRELGSSLGEGYGRVLHFRPSGDLHRGSCAAGLAPVPA